jgi:4,5-dihydroxyphthalate decarboxylase
VLSLSVATGRYDRVAALRDGRVRPEGVSLNWLPLKVEEIFWRMLQHREFDGSELSFSGYVIRRGRGADDLIAIPVFLSRSFRHNILYVNADAGIERPEDLKGRRIGVPEYQITAAVWVRGLLEDEYGVRPEDMEWLQGGLEQWGRKPQEPVQPEGVSLASTEKGSTLAAMLADGEIDVLISPRVPSTFDGIRVKRLFADPAAAEREWFERTGIFPIMHTFVLKREIVDANPWLPQTLFKAFEESKRLAMADLRDTTAHKVTLPFLATNVADAEAAMGEDFWPYGVEENRKTLETFLRYAHRQGMVPELLEPEALFPESTWRTSRI